MIRTNMPKRGMEFLEIVARNFSSDEIIRACELLKDENASRYNEKLALKYMRFCKENISFFGYTSDFFELHSAIKKSCKAKKNDVEYAIDFLSKRRYVVPYGCEFLFREIKKYPAKFDANDFDIMCKLHLKAKEECPIKVFAQTVDSSDAKIKYVCADYLNPKFYSVSAPMRSCFHPKGDAFAMMVESIFHPYVQTYLIMRGEETVGKMTCFFDEKNKILMFNTADVAPNLNEKAKRDVYDAFMRAVADQFDAGKIEIKIITMGQEKNDLLSYFANAATTPAIHTHTYTNNTGIGRSCDYVGNNTILQFDLGTPRQKLRESLANPSTYAPPSFQSDSRSFLKCPTF